MASHSRAWIEGEVAKWLGGGGFDHLPDVDSHPVCQYLEFVNQGDVDASIYVFQKLRHFCHSCSRDHHDVINDLSVEDFGNLLAV